MDGIFGYFLFVFFFCFYFVFIWVYWTWSNYIKTLSKLSKQYKVEKAENVFQLMNLINAVICNKVRSFTCKILVDMMSQKNQLCSPADNNALFFVLNWLLNGILISIISMPIPLQKLYLQEAEFTDWSRFNSKVTGV